MWHRSRAMEGVANRRSSSSENSSGCFVSGTRAVTSRSRKPDSGSISMVHRRLNMEWAAAMPGREAGSSSRAGRSSARSRQNTASHTAVPMVLKARWTMAARLAFLFAPTEESIAVTQVPMFCPMMMGTAAP